MTTLAEGKPRTYVGGEHNHLPVIDDDIIYSGAAVSVNSSGYARPLNIEDTKFGGFAEETADNAGGAAGAVQIRVRRKGRIVLPVTGLVITSVGAPVYASDDDTFTMTASTNLQIGVVTRWESNGLGEVAFDIDQPPGTVATADLAADAVTGAKLADDAVSIEHVDDGLLMSHRVIAAGVHSWAGGVAATDSIAVTGLEATDIVLVNIQARGSGNPTSVIGVNDAGNDQIDLVMDQNGEDAVTKIGYAVLRAAA